MGTHEPVRFLSAPPDTPIHYPVAPLSTRGPLAVHSKGTFPKRDQGAQGEERWSPGLPLSLHEEVSAQSSSPLSEPAPKCAPRRANATRDLRGSRVRRASSRPGPSARSPACARSPSPVGGAEPGRTRVRPRRLTRKKSRESALEVVVSLQDAAAPG